VFGAASGFDSLEECFEDLAPEIRAIETGLSSDPAMNWRLSQLDGITLVSNSDAHSAAKMGREANILDTELSYAALTSAIRTRKGFMGTIEFFPEEGKYHYDGHRDCKVRLSPREALLLRDRCPVCGKAVTMGVLHRVEELADREEGYRPDGAPGYTSIIPLPELIAGTIGVGPASKRVEKAYFALLGALGNEFSILREAALADIAAASGPELADAVARMREGRVAIEPGYDGEYGTIRIVPEGEQRVRNGKVRRSPEGTRIAPLPPPE
jgi:uncharacterized protein (TIGR00375 family)